jgi:hypothetical protein
MVAAADVTAMQAAVARDDPGHAAWSDRAGKTRWEIRTYIGCAACGEQMLWRAPCPPNTPPGIAFAARLARAGISQAAFAHLAAVTARQVNNWCRGRAAVPRWAELAKILCG